MPTVDKLFIGVREYDGAALWQICVRDDRGSIIDGSLSNDLYTVGALLDHVLTIWQSEVDAGKWNVSGYHLYQAVDLAECRKCADRIFFDGRVDSDGRIDHYLIIEAKDQKDYIIENGIVLLISLFRSPIQPFIDQCKRTYMLSLVSTGGTDYSKGLAGVTNWNSLKECGEPVREETMRRQR